MKFLPWSRSSRAVLAAFAAAVLLAACGGKPLYSQLDETQANQVMGALIAAGVDADKNPSPSKTGWEVRVATSDFPYAMQVLAAQGLPRAQFANGCDVFRKEGFASSSTEERGREQCALQQELADTLTRFPGVVDARSSVGELRPEFRVDVRRDVANEVGLDISQVAATVTFGRPFRISESLLAFGMVASAGAAQADMEAAVAAMDALRARGGAAYTDSLIFKVGVRNYK